ncbi:MAG: hypothetical protein M0017_13565 [Desulfobacteraceae bacterium]|nr:hypothetical protein [Desulfobacteraceae bacterium]
MTTPISSRPRPVPKLQIDAHTSIFKGSDFNTINSWATQAVGGFTFALPADFLLDIAFSENIFIETAPDVGLIAALKKTF